MLERSGLTGSENYSYSEALNSVVRECKDASGLARMKMVITFYFELAIGPLGSARVDLRIPSVSNSFDVQVIMPSAKSRTLG